jgi:hypothetical protein
LRGDPPQSEGDVSLMARLRVVFLCVTLEIGVLAGVPIRPDEIQRLMQQMNRPTLAHVLPAEKEDREGDDGPHQQ